MWASNIWFSDNFQQRNFRKRENEKKKSKRERETERDRKSGTETERDTELQRQIKREEGSARVTVTKGIKAKQKHENRRSYQIAYPVTKILCNSFNFSELKNR